MVNRALLKEQLKRFWGSLRFTIADKNFGYVRDLLNEIDASN